MGIRPPHVSNDVIEEGTSLKVSCNRFCSINLCNGSAYLHYSRIWAQPLDNKIKETEDFNVMIVLAIEKHEVVYSYKLETYFNRNATEIARQNVVIEVKCTGEFSLIYYYWVFSENTF